MLLFNMRNTRFFKFLKMFNYEDAIAKRDLILMGKLRVIYSFIPHFVNKYELKFFAIKL